MSSGGAVETRSGRSVAKLAVATELSCSSNLGSSKGQVFKYLNSLVREGKDCVQCRQF